MDLPTGMYSLERLQASVKNFVASNHHVTPSGGKVLSDVFKFSADSKAGLPPGWQAKVCIKSWV